MINRIDLLEPITEATEEGEDVSTKEIETEVAEVQETQSEEGGDCADSVDPSDDAQTLDANKQDSPIDLPSPDPKLFVKIAEMREVQRKLINVKEAKKSSARSFAEREKALESQIEALGEEIDELSWHERFVPEEGVVYRTNLLNPDLTEVRPYEPPAQAELNFRLLDSTQSVPREGNDSESLGVLGVLEDEVGQTVEQVLEALDLDNSHYTRIETALNQLVDTASAKVAIKNDETVYLLGDERDAEVYNDVEDVDIDSDIDDHDAVLAQVKPQWRSASEIGLAAGVNSKVAGRVLRGLFAKGAIEAEGEKRGRKYRIVEE